MRGLSFYGVPFLKSLSGASNSAGSEMIRNNGHVNEYEAQSAIIPFVDIIMRK